MTSTDIERVAKEIDSIFEKAPEELTVPQMIELVAKWHLAQVEVAVRAENERCANIAKTAFMRIPDDNKRYFFMNTECIGKLVERAIRSSKPDESRTT